MSRDETKPERRLLFLGRADVESIIGNNYTLFLDVVRDSIIAHAKGLACQPIKTYVRKPGEGVAYDRLIAMSAYLDSPEAMIGIKWIGSKRSNPGLRGLERASALIILNDSTTYYPLAVVEGGLISGLRTASVSVLAAERLALSAFDSLAIIGCGAIGRLHALMMVQGFASIKRVYLYDIDVVRCEGLAEEIARLGIEPRVCSDAKEVVQSAGVVVSCTVADEAQIRANWLPEGVFVCNVSLADVERSAYLEVDKLVVDDWQQANVPGKILNDLVVDGQLSRDDIYGELGEILMGELVGRADRGERILLHPMGLAVEDVSCAALIYRIAAEREIGTWLRLT